MLKPLPTMITADAITVAQIETFVAIAREKGTVTEFSQLHGHPGDLPADLEFVDEIPVVRNEYCPRKRVFLISINPDDLL